MADSSEVSELRNCASPEAQREALARHFMLHRRRLKLMVDLRLDKSFILVNRYRASLVFDVFNLTNEDYVTEYSSTRIERSDFLEPITITDARIYQLGVRFIF